MAKEITPEQQIDALNKQIADFKRTSAQKDAEIASQKGQIASQGSEIAALKSDLAERVQEVRGLKDEAEANEQVLAAHQARLSAAEVSAKAGAPTVEHEGAHYVLVVPSFQYQGKRVTREQLQANADLVAELVTKGSGMLKKVE